MKFIGNLSRVWVLAFFASFALAALSSTGCTVYSNGMTLPNPYYHKNVPQYFPRGSEFPFSNEAANLQESDREVQRGF